MRVTSKGQVTIPQRLREKMGIVQDSEIDFIEDKDRVYLKKIEQDKNPKSRFKNLRGISTVKMSTDEIMALTRKES